MQYLSIDFTLLNMYQKTESVSKEPILGYNSFSTKVIIITLYLNLNLTPNPYDEFTLKL